jgi:hypothetical protein
VALTAGGAYTFAGRKAIAENLPNRRIITGAAFDTRDPASTGA